MDDERLDIEEATEAEAAEELAVLDGVSESAIATFEEIGEDDEVDDELEDEESETEVTCTEHTPENLRGYVILLAISLFILVSSTIRVATIAPGTEKVISALAILIAAIAAVLAAYMLFVWKNRKVVVNEEGIALTDFLGKESVHPWSEVKVIDRRPTTNVEIAFRVGRREETFASTCGGFRRMCELLIRLRKLRRIDERALAKKRKAKSLFDVVKGGRREEKVDESLYLPELPESSDGEDKAQ